MLDIWPSPATPAGGRRVQQKQPSYLGARSMGAHPKAVLPAWLQSKPDIWIIYRFIDGFGGPFGARDFFLSPKTLGIETQVLNWFGHWMQGCQAHKSPIDSGT